MLSVKTKFSKNSFYAAAIVLLILSALFLGLFSCGFNVSDEAALGTKLKEGFMHDAENPTALTLKDSDFVYNSSNNTYTLTISNSIGSSSAGIGTNNISMTWSSKDRDDDGLYSKKSGNMSSPSGYGFSVEYNDDYGSYNGFGAVLNLRLPQFMIDLINSGTVTASISAKLSMRKTWNMLGDGGFYVGIKSSSTLIKPNQQNVTNWDDRPNADKYLSGFALSGRQSCNDGDWGDTQANVSASGATISGQYLGIGISGMSDHYPGYSTPEARITNIVITFSYSTTFKVSSDSHGSADYIWYKNATPSSIGSISSQGTIAAGNEITATTSNPYAFLVVIPKNTVTGYRFKELNAATVSNLGYAGNADVADADMPSATIASISTAGGYSPYPNAAARLQNKESGNTVNFTARQYTIIFRPNGGSYQSGYSASNAKMTCYYGTEYTVPDVKDYCKNNMSGLGWTYTTDTQTGINESNRGSTFTSGNKFKNIFSNLNTNLLTIYFDAVWVEAAIIPPTDSSITITPGAYKDLYSDVTVTVTGSKPRYKLSQIYATYTSGDISGEKIALEKVSESGDTSTWILYGICGNCNLSAEWVTDKYSITYSWNGGSGTNGPTEYYYGTAVALPFSGTRSGYTLDGWNLSVASGGYLPATSQQYYIQANSYGNITATARWISTSVTPTNNANSTANSPDTTGVSGTGFNNAITGLGTTYKSGKSTFDETAMTAATQTITLPTSIQYALRAGATVTATLRGVLDIGVLNDNYVIAFSDPDGSRAFGRIGINGTYAAYSSTGFAKVYDWDSSAETLTVTQQPSAVPLGQSDTSLTVYVQLKREKVNKRGTAWFYAILSSFTVTYSVSGGSPLTVTYNGNGGKNSSNSTTTNSTYVQSSVNGSVSVLFPDSMFSRTGYEFVGWGPKDNTSVSGALAPGSSATVSSNTTYYAVWRKKKYPFISYDVWTDGTNYGTTVRTEYVVQHEASIDMYYSSSGTAANSNGSSYSNIRAFNGGNDYNGFTVQKIMYQLNRSSSNAFQSNEWKYEDSSFPKGTAIDPGTSSWGRIPSATGARWAYYIWSLNDLTATVDTPSPVDYGTSVDMDTLLHPAHEATEKSFSWVWVWSDTDGNAVDFYKNHELFLVEESGNYSVAVTVTVERGGKELSKTLRDVSLNTTVTINPLYLKIDADGDRTFDYNGESREFPLKTVLDENYYRDSYSSLSADELNSKIAYLKSVFEKERSENDGRLPWFYDENSNNTLEKWRYGLAVSLIGLGYSSYIADGSGTEFYEGTAVDGTRQFRDAGSYWVSIMHLLKASGTTALNADYNKNYIWTANKNAPEADRQILTAESAGAESTVHAEIRPADGFDLYAFYVQKTFGIISDPTPTAINLAPTDGSFDIDALKQLWSSGGSENADKFEETWLLSITGLFENDFNAYSELIASKLKRDVSAALHQQAGLYDVYMDVTLAAGQTVRKEFLALLNNYGVKISSPTNNAEGPSELCALPNYGTIKMHWVNADGTLKSGEFDFTTKVKDYAGERNNFEIIPKELNLTYEAKQTFTYDGTAQGPNNIVTSGFLSEEEKAAFAQEYGNGYEKFFTIYFFGVPIPYSTDWNGMTDAEKASYIENNKLNKNIVGYGEYNNVTGVGDKYAISLYEINAGDYAVVIFEAAYKDSDGSYKANESFNISSPLHVKWQIQKRDIGVDVSHTSMTFGDTNYGGAGFTFKNIVESDEVKIKNLSVFFNGANADGFLRYADLNAEKIIKNGNTLYVYGSHAGNYTVDIDDILTLNMEEATTLYGFADNDYGRADTNYTVSVSDPFTIIHRTLTTEAAQYTADGGNTFSSNLPDMTYVYNVKKGVKITVGNFYSKDFLKNDIAAKESAYRLIPSADIIDRSQIEIAKEYGNAEYTAVSDLDAGAVTMLFFGINAATYAISITDITYTDGGETYNNYELRAVNANFTITPKTITVQWTLDSNVVTTAVPSVVYDGKPHSVTARFVSSASGKFVTTDNLVYYDDYISTSQIYTQFDGKAPKTLSFSSDANHTYTDVNNNKSETYTTYLTQFTDGNYRLAEEGDGSRVITWAITRREFTMVVANPGNTFIYDGNYKQIVLTFDSGDVEVILTDFDAITSGANFRYTQGLIFSANTKAFSAVDSKIYEFSYDAGSGIKIDNNWILTGKADYTGDNFLFAIVPRVIELNFNHLTETYDSTNLIQRFYPAYAGSVSMPSGDVTYTYNLNEIIHAGSYDLTVLSSVSESGNFVLAEKNPTDWYATIAGGRHLAYYSDNDIISAYSATVAVNPYTVTLNPALIEAELVDIVYDGLEHGYTLAAIYEKFVKNSLLTEADKNGYSLSGSASTGIDCGNYNVIISGFNPLNGHTDYRLAREDGYSTTWSITRRPLSFVYTPYHSGGNDYVYDGNRHGYNLVVQNIVDGEFIKLVFNGINVNITSPLTVGAVNSTNIYGSDATAYSVTNFALSDATVEGVTYKSSNYRLPEGGADKSWTIERKIITVEWHNTLLTYRASVYAPDNGGVYATVTNSVAGDVFNLNYGGQSTGTNAGEYTISIEDLTGGDYSNYKIDGTLSTKWKIEAKKLSQFEWKGAGSGFTAPPELSVTYDGANHNIFATPIKGAENADDGKIYDADAQNFTFTYSSSNGSVVYALTAGDYKTKIIGCNSNNYSISADADTEKSWKILPRELTVEYKYNYGKTITYCAAARGVVLEISGFVNSDFGPNLNFTVTSNVESDSLGTAASGVYTRALRSVNVGKFTAAVKIDENSARASSYVLKGVLEAAFEITPLTAILEWRLCDGHANLTAEYDGKPHELHATVANLASSSDIANVTVSDGIKTDKGEYTGVASAIDNKNYALPADEAARSRKFTITARAVNALWESTADSYSYNGKYISDSLTLSRLISSDEVTFKIEFFKETDGVLTSIGTAAVKKNGADSYVLTAADFKKTIDYGTYVAVFDGKVYLSDGSVNENYSFTPVANNDTTRYTISRATVNLSGIWNYTNEKHSGILNDSTILIYNAKPYAITTELDISSLFVRDDTGVRDDIAIVYTGNENTHVGVGSYTAVASSLSGVYAANYRLPTENVSVSYVITPKLVNLVWSGHENLVYNGQTRTITAIVKDGATADDDGLSYDGDSVSVSQYKDNAFSHADSYVAKAVGLDNTDYAINPESAGNGTFNWTISPRPAEFDWLFTKVEYDGTLKTVTATISNLVPGDSVNLTYKNNSFVAKGTYIAEITALDNTDYTLTAATNVTHDWEITPIILAFGWSGGSGLSYDGTLQGLTLTVSNIAAADFASAEKLAILTETSPTGVQTVAENRESRPLKITFKATDAGTYGVTVTGIGGLSKDNYVLPDNVSSSYTIAPRVITVDWTAGDYIYAKTNYNVKATVTNLVSDDTIILSYRTDGANYSVSGEDGAGNIAMHAGKYSTVITSVDNKNYTVVGASDLTYEWTIKAKTLTDVTFKLDGGDLMSLPYDHAVHTLTATANASATAPDDGKLYDNDSVSFIYTGTVITDFGLSAINRNAAVEAGEYSVSLAVADNNDYVIESLSASFNIERRVLTVTKENVTDTEFIYDGNLQGVKLTVNNLIEYDNTNTGFNLSPVFVPSGSAENAVRSGAAYSRRFLATDAGDYTVTVTADGERSANYILAPYTAEFTIIRKQITTKISAEITQDNVIYRAEPISPSELGVTFGNLVAGDNLILNDDYTVSFSKDGLSLEGAPINVGSYIAKISLSSSGTASGNYELIGETDFAFSVEPYEITPNMLSWILNGTEVNLDNLTFKENENKTVTVDSVNDTIFNKIAGKVFSYAYFGLCNCGLSASSPSDLDEEHLAHQHLLDDDGNFKNIGPQHAGSYFIVLTLSGGDAENFVLSSFDGYVGNYFMRDGNDVYLVYNRSTDKFIDKPLPALGDRIGALRFGIGRLTQGIVVESKSSLPFKGSAYTVEDGLPKVTAAADTSNIRVEIGSGTYTYEEYSSLAFNAVRNAGEYRIKIYDSSASGGTISGCDLFNSDAEMEVNVTLTVNKAKITVTDNSSPFWSKTYDRTTTYSDFEFAKNVPFTSETDGDGNIIGISDGVIAGTTATIIAVYDDFNAGTRKLTFTIGGTDRGNYYIVLSAGGAPLEENEFTVDGYAYSIENAEITKRVITVAGDADKIFDGTKKVEFQIVSADIIQGDNVSVIGEYASEHVGTHDITLTTDNDNYEIASDISARGTISPKSLTVEWTGKGSSTEYDGNSHGVTATVNGMVDGYKEEITATGNNIGNSVIPADAVYPVSFSSINAGDYSVVLSLKENSDYALSSALYSAEWHITARILDVSWKTDELSDGDYIYAWEGYKVRYSNTRRTVTPVINNLVGADEVKLTVRNDGATVVGDYVAEITAIGGADGGNYELPANYVQAWSIIKAKITSITLPDLESVYNGSAQGVEVSSYVTRHGITVNVVYNGGEFKTAETVNGLNAFKNVTGENGKTITATIAESANYEALSLSATVKITPSPIESITLTSQTVTYDNTEHSLSVNTDMTRYGDKVSVTYTINGAEGNSAKNADTYTVIATIAADNENYITLTRTATLIINKADIGDDRIHMDEDSGTIVYDAQYHGITITVTDGETRYGDKVTVTYYGGENNEGRAKNVGTYEINAVVSAGNNYNNYTTSTSRLTITQKDIRLTLRDSDRSFTYDGNTHTAEVTFDYGAANDTDEKVYDGDDLTITLTYTGIDGAAAGNTELKNAGSYNLSATLSNGNYRAIASTATITINKAEIDGYHFIGDSVSYNKRLHSLGINTAASPLSDPIIRNVNLLATDSGTVNYTFTTTDGGEYTQVFNGAINVGTYYLKAEITPDGDAAGNYEPWVRYAVLEITPALFTSFTMEDLAITYDGLPHHITVNVPQNQVIDGIYYTVHGDAVTVTYTITDNKPDSTGAVTETNGNSATNVNVLNGAVVPYKITAHCTFADDVKNNYLTDNLDISANLTISPATLKDIALEGSDAVYDGLAHDAEITVPSASGYPRFELNVDKSEMTVYLADGHAGDIFTVNLFIEDLAEGKRAIDAGSYDFVVEIGLKDSTLSANYTAISDLRKTVVISPAVAADDKGVPYAQGTNLFFNDDSVTYCGATHYIVLSSENSLSKVTHEIAEVLQKLSLHPSTRTATTDEAEIAYSCDGAAFEGAKNAGVYEITATVSHRNYVSFSLKSTLTVDKATIEYFFVGDTKTYDMVTHFAAVNTKNEYLDSGSVTEIALNGTDAASVAYTYKLNGADMGNFDGALYVGNYEITAEITILGDSAGNYEIWGTDNSKTVNLVINPYETSIVWNGLDVEYVYNGNPFNTVSAYFIGADGKTRGIPNLSYEGISGKADGDSVMKNAGEYKITASHERESNYIFKDKTVNVTVKKAVIERYLVNATVPYAAKTYFLTLTLNRSNSASVTESLVDVITVYDENIAIKYTYGKNGSDAKDGYMAEGVYTELTYGARNAGVYTVTADIDLGAGESNFEDWDTPKTATLTISRLNLTVTSDFEKIYDGTNLVENCVISGILYNAQYISYTARYSDKNVGDNKTITITAETAEGYEYLKDNYVIPAISAGKITAREIILIVNDSVNQASFEFWQKPLYDGLNVTLHNPLPLTTENNVIANDNVTLNSKYNSKNVLEAVKVLFTLTGSDASNYYIENLDFTADVDFEAGIYLINPRVTDVSWSAQNTSYNGLIQNLFSYVLVLGEDAANGRLNLVIKLTQTKDGDGNALSSPITSAVYKNAGAYLAEASLPADTDKNLLANYGVDADSLVREFCISKATVAVNWAGLSSDVFTYNGQDQGSEVKASANLLGDDIEKYKNVNYITAAFTKNEQTMIFKNAGDYSLSASFSVAELNNNYNLSNAARNLTMNKAKINNIFFDGDDSWVYEDGTARYYFVSSTEGTSFISFKGSDGINVLPIYYEFDADTEIIINYVGGDSALTGVHGNNGVKNVGSGIKVISATVAETENYESWNGEITVFVSKGQITNVVMDSYEVVYDALPHRLYARNENVTAANGVFTQVTAPDGSTVNVRYKISVGNYFYSEFDAAHTLDDNYAVNAGVYLIEASISGLENYEDLILPSKDGDPVTLTILQRESEVVWAYNNQVEPNFTYNAANQTSSIQARILGAGTAGEQNSIVLNVSIKLIDEINIDEDLKSKFVVAGNYEMSADFSQTDTEKFKQNKNNYKLTGTAVDVEMKKYTVEITWYNNPLYHGGEKKIYDYNNPCVYNAETHGITAEGIGIKGAIMNIITGGTFDAVNAGEYNALVSSIAPGKDIVNVDGTDYELYYNLNYKLANNELNWRIAPRPITITAAQDNFLSKIYDGSAIFGFNADGYNKSFLTDANNSKVVNIQVTYKTDRSAYDSRFGYYINNVMAVDKENVFLPIASISADRSNVLATQATVAFGMLRIDGAPIDPTKTYNYVVDSVSDGIIQQNDNVITPRDVDMRFQNLSHVYNGLSYSHAFTYDEGINGGLQFNEKYNYVLFYFFNTDPNNPARMQLVDGNYLVGSVDIDGNIRAGEYRYVVRDLKAVDAENNGAENYNIIISNLDMATYTIEKRKIAVDYGNLLQSIQQPNFEDVNIAIDLANSDFTDLEIPEGSDRVSVLENLVIGKDNFNVTVNNSWKTATYTAYTRIVGTTITSGDALPSSPSLTVILNSADYEISAPVLQIVYLQIENAEEFKFLINNLVDLLHLDSDNYGLGETRDLYETENQILPTFTQTADIDGLVDGAYTIMPSIRNFRGVYDGGNHYIRNISVAQILEDSEDAHYAGFFARISEGSVSGLTFTDIHVYASGRVASVGGFAGLADAGTTITNVNFNGTIYVYADTDYANNVKVGGFVGTALNVLSIKSVKVAIKITVVHGNAEILYIGGFAGYVDCGVYENISVFDDVTVKSPQTVTTYLGGIAGYITGDELSISNYRYLSSSLYSYDGSNAGLTDRAFGNDVTFTVTDGIVYDDFISAGDALTALIRDYTVRGYLLPSGADGTSSAPVTVTNFRQISLITAYPYMNFRISGKVRSPLKITTYHRGFYGVITYDDGSSIRSDHPDSASDVPLTDAVKKDTTNVIIGKKEDN